MMERTTTTSTTASTAAGVVCVWEGSEGREVRGAQARDREFETGSSERGRKMTESGEEDTGCEGGVLETVF